MKRNQLQKWLKEVWYWLGEAESVLKGVFVIAVAIFFGFVIWHSKDSIRITGYILQLFGMLYAIQGIFKIRKYFHLPLLRNDVRDWIKRFPKWIEVVSFSVPIEQRIMAAMKPRTEVWIHDKPEKPIEERIEGIVKNLESTRDEQRNHAKLIGKLIYSYEEHKIEAAEQNKKIRDDFHTELQLLHTSDFVSAFVGLAWISLGITMSTLAPELARLLY